MGVTNVILGGLSIHDNVKYAVANDTLTTLEAMAPQNPIMVDMTNRAPVYIRSQIQARPVGLTVFLLRPNALDRKVDYDALIAAADPSAGLVALTWVDSGGPTKSLLVHASSFIPSNWFSRASSEMIAPNPIPTVS